MAYNSSLVPYVSIFNLKDATRLRSSLALELSTWTHLAFVYSLGNVSMYTNGQLTDFSAGFSFRNITKKSNFFGHSNFNQDPDVNAVFDEIKIFNRPLSPAEIETEMDKFVFFYKIYL